MSDLHSWSREIIAPHRTQDLSSFFFFFHDKLWIHKTVVSFFFEENKYAEEIGNKGFICFKQNKYHRSLLAG